MYEPAIRAALERLRGMETMHALAAVKCATTLFLVIASTDPTTARRETPSPRRGEDWDEGSRIVDSLQPLTPTLFLREPALNHGSAMPRILPRS